MLRSKLGTGAFNRAARRFGLPSFPSTLSLWMGDYTLASDLPEALEIPAEYDLRAEDYTGPLLANLGIPLEEEVRAHLEWPGRSIYFAMGSSGNKEIYLRMLSALSRTPYPAARASSPVWGQTSEAGAPKLTDFVARSRRRSRAAGRDCARPGDRPARLFRIGSRPCTHAACGPAGRTARWGACGRSTSRSSRPSHAAAFVSPSLDPPPCSELELDPSS